jgi:DUF1680 family protein
MYSAMADVAALTGDPDYLAAIDRLWSNVVEKKLSVTGGVGALRQNEGYAGNYQLPNQPYNETCAAIANVYWNHRMFLLHGDAKYMDVLERSLYNGVISGLSLNGTLFFYPNTLQHDGESAFNQGVNGRSPWFNCSCCPSNLSRFIPSVAGYAYAVKGADVYINLFMNSQVNFQIPNGELKIKQLGNYHGQGKVKLVVCNEEAVEADLYIRIPGWAINKPLPSDLFRYADKPVQNPVLKVNGEEAEIKTEKGYAVLKGKWKRGDEITLELPMEVRFLHAHEKVREKSGLVALQFGPMVYCAEEIDNRTDVLDIQLATEASFVSDYRPDLLGGVSVLKGEELTLIPYYAWANREVGKMNVWFKQSL